MEFNKIILSDCMNIMRDIPDKYFELALVDPPYGIGNTTTSKGNKKRTPLHRKITWNNNIPTTEYFQELYRISKHQIIWGCNYFYPHVLVPGRIVHYKDPFQNLDDGKIKFCPCDLASQSFDNRIEFFKYNWYGNSQGGKPNFKNIGIDKRIHPTQKPVALYQWMLQKYAKPGDRILDTHSGSGTCAIACLLEHHDFLAIEKDKDYHRDSVARLEEVKSQGRLF